MKSFITRSQTIALLLFAIPQSAEAYIGPGAGISVIGTVIALFGAILLAIVGFIWYPVKRFRAKKKKQQGTVEMHLLINEHGVVSDLRLKQTIPDSDLNDVAINNVRRWRFDPAREGDVAVRVWKPVSIVYTIESGRTRVDLLE